MPAQLLLRERNALSPGVFVEIVVWRVPVAVKGSAHAFKYSLALVSDQVCVLRYDNEAGKGDHKHIDGKETTYLFSGLERLQADFWRDVEIWKERP